MKKMRLKVVSVVGFVIIALSSVGFWSCENSISLKEEYKTDKNQDFLEIENGLDEISDLFNPENLTIYNKASLRFQKYLIIKEGTLAMRISCGSEVNVAEDIFQYYMSNVKQNNAKINSGDLLAYVDDDGVIRLSSSVLFIQQIRVKSQSVENDEEDDEPINMDESDDPAQEIWDRLKEGGDESLADLLDLSSIDFTQGDLPIGTFQMTTSVNGRPCILTIGNACMAGGDTFDPDNDCELNNFNEGFNSITDDNHWGIPNNSGSPLVTFWFY